MMIEYIRRNSVAALWCLARGNRLDPGRQPGMIAIADAIESNVNKRHTIYERAL
jgi:hypothetical protein